MKLCMDHQIFSYQRFGGASRYCYELINELRKEIEVSLAITYSDNEYLMKSDFFKTKDFFDVPPGRKIRLLKIFFVYLINRMVSIRALGKKDYDIFHPSYYDSYFLKYLGNKPFVFTMLDMNPQKFPEMFLSNGLYSKFVTQRWIDGQRILSEKASKIIAISDYTKNDIIKFFGTDESKIEVIYLGNSLEISSDPLPHNIKLPERYLLFVGNRGIYKNFIRFIEGVSSLLKKDGELNIVCAGGGLFNSQEKALFEKFDIKERVYQYGISDAFLSNFYKNALSFVFPSICEGFGIPIIEAFSCNCPVILSNSTCFPEIALDCAVYFDGNSPASIGDAVEKVIYNEGLRKDMISKGRERAKVFTWENTAEKTLALYKTLV